MRRAYNHGYCIPQLIEADAEHIIIKDEGDEGLLLISMATVCTVEEVARQEREIEIFVKAKLQRQRERANRRLALCLSRHWSQSSGSTSIL